MSTTRPNVSSLDYWVCVIWNLTLFSLSKQVNLTKAELARESISLFLYLDLLTKSFFSCMGILWHMLRQKNVIYLENRIKMLPKPRYCRMWDAS